MDAKELYETLSKIQQSKGYYFNKDEARTMDLLNGLLMNKERYGYMSCPCRLASGDREKQMSPSMALATATCTSPGIGTKAR
jgi:ferredoxin-thioredoxin reductase catalytic chain